MAGETKLFNGVPPALPHLGYPMPLPPVPLAAPAPPFQGALAPALCRASCLTSSPPSATARPPPPTASSAANTSGVSASGERWFDGVARDCNCWLMLLPVGVRGRRSTQCTARGSRGCRPGWHHPADRWHIACGASCTALISHVSAPARHIKCGSNACHRGRGGEAAGAEASGRRQGRGDTQEIVGRPACGCALRSALVADGETRARRRLEKNRESARECRRRKKEYVKDLEVKAARLEAENTELRLQVRGGPGGQCRHGCAAHMRHGVTRS